jgi:hypothetical protein
METPGCGAGPARPVVASDRSAVRGCGPDLAETAGPAHCRRTLLAAALRGIVGGLTVRDL